MNLELAVMLVHPMSWIMIISLLGIAGMAIQQNLGAFNQNAWAQTLQIAGSQVNTDAAAGAHVVPANFITGFLTNYVLATGMNGVNYTTRTAAQMAADLILQDGYPFNTGQGWEVTIINTGGGTVTLVGGTGVTIVGTATIANNTSRTWLMSWNGAQGANASFTLTNVGSGTN